MGTVSRRAFLGVVALIAGGVGVVLGDAEHVVYLPVVSRETLAAWGWAGWDEFSWG